MRYILDKSTEPYFNLAAEEYLLKGCDEPVFRLWRNAPSVIIGRYQNAVAEINRPWMEEHNIPVVRRLSGGGAVFHDLGNINYTFIDTRRQGEDTSAMFRRFTAPIVSALRAIGVDAALEGRNDLLIDGRKFSGNAIAVHRDRVLQHGTLLFNSSISNLSLALKNRPEKFAGKGVKSTAARVTNIAEHLPGALKGMDVEEMMEYLMGCIAPNAQVLSCYSEEEMEIINGLMESRYATTQWNYGKSPAYTYHNSVKLSCGLLDIYLRVENGIIIGCTIMGDYFFLRPTEELSELFIGQPHTSSSVRSILSTIHTADYFGSDISEELVAVFCS